MSSATYGRRFSKFEKRPKMPPSTAFGRILVAHRFVCRTNWWASCLTILCALPNSWHYICRQPLHKCICTSACICQVIGRPTLLHCVTHQNSTGIFCNVEVFLRRREHPHWNIFRPLAPKRWATEKKCFGVTCQVPCKVAFGDVATVHWLTTRPVESARVCVCVPDRPTDWRLFCAHITRKRCDRFVRFKLCWKALGGGLGPSFVKTKVRGR